MNAWETEMAMMMRRAKTPDELLPFNVICSRIIAKPYMTNVMPIKNLDRL